MSTLANFSRKFKSSQPKFIAVFSVVVCGSGMAQQDEHRVKATKQGRCCGGGREIVPKGDGQRMNFASDNTAGIAPPILDAIARANDGSALAYGDDATTAGVERRLSELFERDVAAFLVPTGTAANALAIAQM